MTKADAVAGRIQESGRALFINNTPESWSVHVLQLPVHSLAPGAQWLTPPIGKPGIPAWVSAKCKCTSGHLSGRWMYNPLVGLGWSHELRYWAWRHGLDLGDGLERPERYYTGYFGIMEALVALEQICQAGLKEAVVQRAVSSLSFFAGQRQEESAGAAHWLEASMAEPAMQEQLPALAALLQMGQAARVQGVVERLLQAEPIIDAAVAPLLHLDPPPGGAVVEALQVELAREPDLQMPLMFALAPLMQGGAAQVLQGLMGRIPLTVLTPILKRVAALVSQGKELPVDLPRLERMGSQLGEEVTRALAQTPELASYSDIVPAISEHHPALVVYLVGSLMSQHGVTVDEFMELGVAMGLQSRGRVAALQPIGLEPKLRLHFEAVLNGEAKPCAPANVRQMDLPPACWALTFAQFLEFVQLCRSTKRWAELRAKQQFVTMYDVDHEFVRPLTRGTGCSLALLMNAAQEPRTADVMLSHAWGEDVEECAEALEAFCHDRSVPLTTAVWFCVFSIYQPGSERGDPGPTIGQQVALKPSPFQQVIRSSRVRSGGGMLVLHTTTAEVYDRLWCVHEIDEALEQRVAVRAACSSKYSLVQTIIRFVAEFDVYQPGVVDADFTVFTREAECGSPEDTRMIREAVEAKEGGYARLDRVISSFRKEMLSGSLNYWRQMNSGRRRSSESPRERLISAFRQIDPAGAGRCSRDLFEATLCRVFKAQDVDFDMSRFLPLLDGFCEGSSIDYGVFVDWLLQPS